MNQLPHFKAKIDDLEKSYQQEYPCNDAVKKKYLYLFELRGITISLKKMTGQNF